MTSGGRGNHGSFSVVFMPGLRVFRGRCGVFSFEAQEASRKTVCTSCGRVTVKELLRSQPCLPKIIVVGKIRFVVCWRLIPMGYFPESLRR